MAKIRLTKGELKKQRDALRRYERYLPTLQLKKQQLQMEILHQLAVLGQKRDIEEAKAREIDIWAGLLSDPKAMDLSPSIRPKDVKTGTRNIAGVDIPVFDHAEFETIEYDLFITPPWVDAAIDDLRAIVAIIEERRVIEKGIEILRHELRITTQRVNLFEKVKIPEAEEAIRRIKIYIGDQMTNGVGRSKMAKRKIGEVEFSEVSAW